MCNVKGNVYVQSYAEEQHFVCVAEKIWDDLKWFEKDLAKSSRKLKSIPIPIIAFKITLKSIPIPDTLNQSQSNHLFLRVWFKSDLNQIRLDSAQVWLEACHSRSGMGFRLSKTCFWRDSVKNWVLSVENGLNLSKTVKNL